MTTILRLICAVVALVVTGQATAWASGPTETRGPLIHRSVDAASGATIRLYQLSSSELTMEVEGRGVKVTKTLRVAESAVAIARGAERISFVMTPGVLLVSTPATRIRMTPANALTERGRIERLVQSSALYRDGLALLRRVRVPQKSALNLLILPTKAFLEGPLGESGARVEMRQWAKSMTARPQMVRVAYQNEPGECWALYSQEAIEAWLEFEDCLASAPWNGWPWDTNCKGIYTIRAIGAAAWWSKCVALN